MGVRRWSAAAAVALVSCVGVPAVLSPAQAVPAAQPVRELPVPGSEWWYQALDLANAWKVSRGAGVTVAVVDSGVQASLPDLAGQVLPGKDFTNAGGDGRTDVQDPDFTISFGHGTNMAVAIAGTGAGTGYVGIAPAAKILPVKLAPDDPGTQLPDGIRWAVDHGATIVNVSVETLGSCTAYQQQAVTYATQHNVIVDVAAGNVPSARIGLGSCVGAITIGAIDANLAPWSGESTGPFIDFAEPGVNLPALGLDGVLRPGRLAGTSSAAAIMSGIFALLRSKFPQDSAADIVRLALWNLHNGTGEAGRGKRVNDQIGYGVPLPQVALTTAPPASFGNPIYDQIQAYDKTAAPSPSPVSGGVSSADATSAKSGSSSLLPLVIVGIAVAAALVVLVIVLSTRRRRPPPGPPGYAGGYPPPGYGPPH